MDFSPLFNLLIVLALILINGYFVAAEFSLVSMRQTRVDQLVEEGVAIARFIQRAKQDPSRFLSASQTGITLASLALGWVAEPTVAELIIRAFHATHLTLLSEVVLHTIAAIVTFLLITYLHIVLGELVPKALALSHTEATVLVTAWPMRYITVVCTPFSIVLSHSSLWLLERLNMEAVPHHHLAYSEEELKRIVNASHEVGVLEAGEQQMLQKVFAFSDRVAREVMVPRPDVEMLSVSATWQEVVHDVRVHAHTRFPVYEDEIDNVLGLFHAKDLFDFLEEKTPEQFNLRDVIRPIQFVPENKSVDDLLHEFRHSRSQIAIVMDEFGGVAGLVTLEDLLEEIVGEIEDEFDVTETEIERIAPGHYLLDGGYRIQDFNERFGADLDTEDFDTMAGLVFGQLGREPQVGDGVEIGKYHFTVKAMEGHRITRLSVRYDEAPETPAEPGEGGEG